jgi:hypothetical protein
MLKLIFSLFVIGHFSAESLLSGLERWVLFSSSIVISGGHTAFFHDD